MDLKSHWQTIRREAAVLDPESAALDAQEVYAEDRTHLDKSKKEIWVVSLENPSVGSSGGQVCSAHPMNAARMLFDRTHALATEAEIRAHLAVLDHRRQVTEDEETARRGLSTKQMMEMLLVSQAAGQRGNKATKEN